MKPRLTLLLLSALTLGAGCAKPTATVQPAMVDTAHWRMTLTCTPAAPRQLDPAQFQVQIADSAGKPISGASVTLALAMPTMDMGRNEVTATAGAPGVYAGAGRFTMPGDWSVTAQAAKGDQQQAQSFPITVR